MQLTESDLNVRFPNLSPCGDYIVYISNHAAGPHATCNQLVKFDLGTKKHKIIVPIVQAKSKTDFPGLYVFDIIPKPWLCRDGKTYILLNTFWHSREVIVAVDIEQGQVVPLTNQGNESWTLLWTSQEWILALCSFVNRPPSLVRFTKLGPRSFW